MNKYLSIELFNDEREESVKSMEILSDRNVAEYYLKERDGFLITDDKDLIEKYMRAFAFDKDKLNELFSERSIQIMEKMLLGETFRVNAIYKYDEPEYIEDYGEYQKYENQMSISFKEFDMRANPYLNKIIKNEIYIEPAQLALGQLLFDLIVLLDAPKNTVSYLRTNLVQINFRHNLQVPDWRKSLEELKNGVIKSLYKKIYERITLGELKEFWNVNLKEENINTLRIGLYNKHGKWFANNLDDEEMKFYELIVSINFLLNNHLKLYEIKQKSSNIIILSKEVINVNLEFSNSTGNNKKKIILETKESKIYQEALNSLRELGVDENDESIKILKEEIKKENESEQSIHGK